MTKPVDKRHCCEKKIHFTEEQEAKIEKYCHDMDTQYSPTLRGFVMEGLNYRLALMEERIRQEAGLEGSNRAANDK